MKTGIKSIFVIIIIVTGLVAYDYGICEANWDYNTAIGYFNKTKYILDVDNNDYRTYVQTRNILQALFQTNLKGDQLASVKSIANPNYIKKRNLEKYIKIPVEWRFLESSKFESADWIFFLSSSGIPSTIHSYKKIKFTIPSIINKSTLTINTECIADSQKNKDWEQILNEIGDAPIAVVIGIIDQLSNSVYFPNNAKDSEIERVLFYTALKQYFDYLENDLKELKSRQTFSLSNIDNLKHRKYINRDLLRGILKRINYEISNERTKNLIDDELKTTYINTYFLSLHLEFPDSQYLTENIYSLPSTQDEDIYMESLFIGESNWELFEDMLSTGVKFESSFVNNFSDKDTLNNTLKIKNRAIFWNKYICNKSILKELQFDDELKKRFLKHQYTEVINEFPISGIISFKDNSEPALRIVRPKIEKMNDIIYKQSYFKKALFSAFKWLSDKNKLSSWESDWKIKHNIWIYPLVWMIHHDEKMDEFIKGIEQYKEFIDSNRNQLLDDFLIIIMWSDNFWQPRLWGKDEDSLFSTFITDDKELECLENYVTLISLFLNQLSIPIIETKEGIIEYIVPPWNIVEKRNFSKVYTKVQTIKNENTKKLFNNILYSLYGGALLEGSKTIKSQVLKQIKDWQKLPNQMNNIFRSNSNEVSKNIFDLCIKNRPKELYNNVSKKIINPNQAVYYIDNKTEFNLQGISSIFEDTFNTLYWLATARFYLYLGEYYYRSAGFFFPSVESNKTIDINKSVIQKAIRNLISARMIYLYLTGLPKENADIILKRLGESIPIKLGAKTKSNDIIKTSFFSNNLSDRLRPSSLEVITYVHSHKNYNSDYATSVFLGLSKSNMLLSQIESGQDAFGFVGPIQKKSMDEIKADLIKLAGYLKKDLTKFKGRKQKEYNLKEKELQVKEAEAQISIQTKELAQSGIEFEIAKMQKQISEKEVNIKKLETVARGLSIDSARYMANSYRKRADKFLIEYNLDSYEAFVLRSQYQMLLTALPAYLIELNVAKRQLIHINKNIIEKYISYINQKRKEFLDSQKKKTKDIVRKVVVVIADGVSMYYQLPPLGTIADNSVRTVEAANDENWEKAFLYLARAAKAADKDGAISKKIKEEFKDDEYLNKIIDYADKIRQDDNIRKVIKSANDIGIDKIGEAQTLSLIKRTGESVLPESLCEYLIPEENIQKDDIETVMFMQAKFAAPKIMTAAANSSISSTMEMLEEGKLKRFIKDVLNEAGIKHCENQEKLHESEEEDSCLKKDVAEIQEVCLETVKNIINDAYSNNEPSKEAIDEKISKRYNKDRNNFKKADPRFEELLNDFDMNAKPYDIKDRYHALIKYCENDTKKEKIVKRFFSSVDEKRIWQGKAPVSGNFFTNLINDIIQGEYSKNLVANYPTTKEDLKERGKELREVMIKVQSAIDTTVTYKVCELYIPHLENSALFTLNHWYDHLNQVKNDPDPNKSDEIKVLLEEIERYYEDIRDEVSQVNLSDEVKQKLINMPKVMMDEEIKTKLLRFDKAINIAKREITKLIYSEDKLKNYIHEMVKAEDENYTKAKNNLINELRQPVKKSITEIDNAINIAGILKCIDSFFDGNNSLTNWVKSEIEKINKLEKDPKANLSKLNNKIKDIKNNCYKEFAKAYLPSDFFENNNKSNQIKDRYKPIVGRFVGNNIYLSDDISEEDIFQRVKEALGYLINQIGNDNSASGLFQLAYDYYTESFEMELEAAATKIEHESEEMKAISYAHNATEAKVRSEQSQIILLQAKIKKNIVKLSEDKAKIQIGIEGVKLESAQKLYQRAVINYNKELFNNWIYQQAGSTDEHISPLILELVQENIWRNFRDIVFISTFYEGNDNFEESFLSFVKHLKFNEDQIANGGRWRPGRWRHEWITKSIDEMDIKSEVCDYNRKYRFINFLHHLKINKKILDNFKKTVKRLANNASIGAEYYEILVDLIPSTNYKKPIFYKMYNEGGERWKNQKRYISNFEQCPQCSRSVFIDVSGRWYVPPGDIELENAIKVDLFHLGNGYITQSSASEEIYKISWPINGGTIDIDHIVYKDHNDINKQLGQLILQLRRYTDSFKHRKNRAIYRRGDVFYPMADTIAIYLNKSQIDKLPDKWELHLYFKYYSKEGDKSSCP
jgi:hypothetical protein